MSLSGHEQKASRVYFDKSLTEALLDPACWVRVTEQNTGREGITRLRAETGQHDVILECDLPLVITLFRCKFRRACLHDARRLADSYSLSSNEEAVDSFKTKCSVV